MMPADDTRDLREKATKHALADVVRLRLFLQRKQQTQLARGSGISCSHIRAILRAEKCCSLFLFLELSRGLGADPCEFLKDILDERDRGNPSRAYPEPDGDEHQRR